jgi:hypothetical protein
MTKVRITKCSNQSYWYKDMIGKEFKLIFESPRDYFVKVKGQKNEMAIPKMDGEVFEESLINRVKNFWR